MINEDLCFQTVAELSRSIAARSLSPVELTRAYLDRLEELNPKISVVITLAAEHAMARAEQAEREIAAGNLRGPLHGIPYALKDLFDTGGIRTTGGSTIYKDRVPAKDGVAVAKLNEAGAVMIAKLAMSEFASGGNNNNLVSHPRNPWKLDRSPAGSSSGSGAATAAGVAGFTLGSETGGSIMGPSGANGVSGIRPTYGRVSRTGVMALAWSLDKAGALARSAEDLGLVLEAMAGHDPSDRTSHPDSAFAFRRDLGSVRGRRIGVVRAEFDSVPEANRAVFESALDVLRQAGYTLVDMELPDRPYGVVYSCLSNTEAGANFKRLYNDQRILGFYSADRRADWMAASLMPAADYIKAQRIRALVKREADEITAAYSALVVPTNTTGSGPIIPPERPDPDARTLGEPPGSPRRLNTIGNLAGLPGVSVPCGFDADGMPLGLHIAASSWADQAALDVGMVFQKDTEFHRLRPAFRA